MKMSVIIPCYNQAKFLPHAVAALQAQTLEEWECIIVDDGSTDNTAEVASNLALQDSRIRLLQKINGGSASARNLGLQQAIGEYIQFLDADDYMDSDKLQKQYQLMQSKRADMCYTAFRHIYADGKESTVHFSELTQTNILTGWGLGKSIPPHAFLYKTTFVQSNYLKFDERCRYREDWGWLIDCFDAHPKIAMMPEYSGVYYFHNETGKTGSYIKMQSGNFTFMAHKSCYLSGTKKLLWAFRISEEIWIWLLRMAKYRSTVIAKCILLLDIRWTIAAILLMPISFWLILAYFIKTYITK